MVSAGRKSVVTIAPCTPATAEPGLANLLARVPNDARPDGFAFDTHAAARVVTVPHVEAYWEAAKVVAARAATAPSPWLGCDTGESCTNGFVTVFLPRLFSHSLDPATTARYRALIAAESFSSGLRTALEAALVSPYFLYRRELGASLSGESTLDSFEVASALSYLFTASPPDDALWAAAQQDQLVTAAQRRQAAERLLATPAARDVIADFGVQWLGVEPVLTTRRATRASTSLSQERARGDAPFHQPRRLRRLAKRFGELTADYSLRDDSSKVPLADGRAGVLGHASVLAHTPTPIKPRPCAAALRAPPPALPGRSAPPPPNAGGVPEVDPNATTRQRFAQHPRTRRAKACHQYIDPGRLRLRALRRHRRRARQRDGLPIDRERRHDDVEALGQRHPRALRHAPRAPAPSSPQSASAESLLRPASVMPLRHTVARERPEDVCAAEGLSQAVRRGRPYDTQSAGRHRRGAELHPPVNAAMSHIKRRQFMTAPLLRPSARAIALPGYELLRPPGARRRQRAAHHLLLFPRRRPRPARRRRRAAGTCTGTENELHASDDARAAAAVQGPCVFFRGLSMGPTDSGSHPGGAKKLLTATDGGNGISSTSTSPRRSAARAPFSAPLPRRAGEPEQRLGRQAHLVSRRADDAARGRSARRVHPRVRQAPAPAAAVARRRTRAAERDRQCAPTEGAARELGDTEKTKLDLHLDAVREVERRIRACRRLAHRRVRRLAGVDAARARRRRRALRRLRAFPQILRAQIDVDGAGDGVRHDAGRRDSGVAPHERAHHEPLHGHADVRPGLRHAQPSGVALRRHARLAHREYQASSSCSASGASSSSPICSLSSPRGPKARARCSTNRSCCCARRSSDGNTHLHDDMPFVLAGGGGGTIRTGQTMNVGYRRHGDLLRRDRECDGR